MISITRNIKVWGIFLLGIFVFSCSDVDSGLSAVDKNGNPTLSFDMTRSPQSIVDNTQVFVFENPSWEFHKKMLGVTSNNNVLSMQAEAGTWNMALVTAETPIASSIKSPVRGETRTGKLWETQSTAGELPSMPELRTSYLTGQQVIANQPNNNNETAMLYRNVALVKVVIDKTRGLDPNGTHQFELHNVPTTLNWAGGLYPNKDNPDTSADPMKGTFTIKDKQGEPGVQDSDTLKFIIPAHKGTDFLGAHNDTTTTNLTLSVDLACLGGVKFEKANVEIPRVPRVNGILLVKLSMIGQLEVTAEILDWKDVALNADLTQTQLFVDKPEVGLSYKDTVYVNTNATNFTFAKDPAATWITALKKIGNNGVEIIANVDTYVDNSPRTSYIMITANNVTKKIPVTQRPDRGTISVDTKELFMSPPNSTKSLVVSTIGGDWKIIGSTLKATPSASSGTTGNTVSFTRATTLNETIFPSVYGDTIVVLKNTTTLDTDTVKLSNLFIYIEDGVIELAQPTLNNDTTTVINNVNVYGASADVELYRREEWIYPWPFTDFDPVTQKFTFKCDKEPNRDERYGEITLQHVDDPDYKVTVTVLQDIIVEIPEFDYYTVKFTWTAGGDVDIKCGFVGNSGTYTFMDGSSKYIAVSFDELYLGWSWRAKTQPIKYGSKELMRWGGDATGGQGETVYFGAPVINPVPYPGQFGVTSTATEVLPRKIKLSIGAAWYTNSSSNAGKPVTCTVAAYRGGTVEPKGTNFDFDGEYVYGDTRTYNVAQITSSSYKNYLVFCTVEYDRKKHTASVVWANTTRSIETPADDLKNIPYEDKGY